MAYEELERRKKLLSTLQSRVEEALAKDEHPPIELSREELGDLGSSMELNESQVVNLFKSLVQEEYLDANIVHSKVSPFHGAILQGLTDKGRRLISLLPPDESIEAVVRALSNLASQIEASEDDPQDKNRKSKAVRGLVDAFTRTASEVGSTGLGKALAEGMFG